MKCSWYVAMSSLCYVSGVRAEERMDGWGTSTFGASCGIKDDEVDFSGTTVGPGREVG